MLHGLGGRRHIAAVGIVGHRVLRALVVIREVKRAREGRKAAAVFADLLRHREYGSDLLYLVLQGVDLAVIGVTRDAVAKLLHLVDVLAGHREAERAACHGAVALACLRVCHTANQREACGSDVLTAFNSKRKFSAVSGAVSPFASGPTSPVRVFFTLNASVAPPTGVQTA